MNMQLIEELIFAHHSALTVPIHVATISIHYSYDDVSFVVDVEPIDDGFDMLMFHCGDEAVEAEIKHVMLRAAAFSALTDATAMSFLQQARQMMLDSDCWTDDEIHQWQFHRLVDIIRRTPTDALAAMNMRLIDVDSERRTVAFG